MDASTPAFLQGTFAFIGNGLEKMEALDGASYTVPFDKRAQLIYFRAGNSADELVSLMLLRDGDVMRYFPLGAKAAMHVPMAVVEDLMPDTELTLCVSAPAGVRGEVVVDIGFVEIA